MGGPLLAASRFVGVGATDAPFLGGVGFNIGVSVLNVGFFAATCRGEMASAGRILPSGMVLRPAGIPDFRLGDDFLVEGNAARIIEAAKQRAAAYLQASLDLTPEDAAEFASLAAELATEDEAKMMMGGARRGRGWRQRGGVDWTYWTGKFSEYVRAIASFGAGLKSVFVSAFPKFSEAISKKIEAAGGGAKGVLGKLDELASKNIFITFSVILSLSASLGLPPPYNALASWSLKTILAITPDNVSMVMSFFTPVFTMDTWVLLGQVLTRAGVASGLYLFSKMLYKIVKPVGEAGAVVGSALLARAGETREQAEDRYKAWVMSFANDIAAKVGPKAGPVAAQEMEGLALIAEAAAVADAAADAAVVEAVAPAPAAEEVVAAVEAAAKTTKAKRKRSKGANTAANAAAAAANVVQEEKAAETEAAIDAIVAQLEEAVLGSGESAAANVEAVAAREEAMAAERERREAEAGTEYAAPNKTTGKRKRAKGGARRTRKHRRHHHITRKQRKQQKQKQQKSRAKTRRGNRGITRKH